MHKEIHLPKNELEPLAAGLANVFIQRRDLYPRQMDNGSYLCIRKPLKDWHITRHLSGEMTLGTYVLDENSKARFLVFDADDEAEMERLVTMTRILQIHNVPGYLESSRRGGHLWLFLSKPVSGKQAQTLGKGLQIAHGLGWDRAFPQAIPAEDRSRFVGAAALWHPPQNRPTLWLHHPRWSTTGTNPSRTNSAAQPAPGGPRRGFQSLSRPWVTQVAKTRFPAGGSPRRHPFRPDQSQHHCTGFCGPVCGTGTERTGFMSFPR